MGLLVDVRVSNAPRSRHNRTAHTHTAPHTHATKQEDTQHIGRGVGGGKQKTHPSSTKMPGKIQLVVDARKRTQDWALQNLLDQGETWDSGLEYDRTIIPWGVCTHFTCLGRCCSAVMRTGEAVHHDHATRKRFALMSVLDRAVMCVCIPQSGWVLPVLPGLPGWTCMATLASSGRAAPPW